MKRDPGVKAFAFVRIGDFSSANDRILAQLRRQFPDLEADLLDVSELKIVNRSDAVPLFFSVAREYGLSACLTRRRLGARAMRTEYCFRKIRARLLQHLSRKPYLFTFQTQSLIDASVPGTPHFVYTDHTHLANLTYPVPSQTPLASKGWRELERSIYQNARLVFTMSSHISRSLTEQYGCLSSRVQCVYAGSNVATPDLGDLGPERFAQKRILFVGVDWERKGGPVLLEAFREVRRSHPTAELIIVGCAPNVAEPGCRVVGRVPLAEVASFYRTASVFCLPTTVEPFGFVFLEAFAYGLPVVATNLGAIPDFVEDGVSGFRVDCNDAEQLARRLSELLDDPARCAAFGARGRALVGERYTWQSTAERIAAHVRPHLGLACRG
ncbi:MAG TPA: glycosyltransferase family 4 protein [Steroidobacteraceae bacterium]|nr:glycosyltransferase family 4 protein [Steroidobacteraceae bacterium]